MLPSGHHVLATALSQALSASPTDRRAGEEVLWASSQQPGHCARLLACAIASGGDGRLDDSTRLCAATQLRGYVHRQWRGSGRGIAAEERPALRAKLIEQLGREEASDAIAMQLALSLARIMRFEANTGAADVLQSFVHALRTRPQPPQALLALLHTAKELSTMRLPAQRAFAARVAIGLLPEVEPTWIASLQAVAAAGAAATPHDLRGAALHTKVVRQLIERLDDARGSLDGVDVASTCPSLAHGATGLCGAALGSIEAVHATHCTTAAWDRLGSALGKLLGALTRVFGDADDFPWARTLSVCERCLLDESELRRTLSARAVMTGGGAADGWAALDARQQHGSSLAARCAAVLTDGIFAGAAEGCALESLVPALLTLMQRSVEQLREWSAEPEALACSELLPPLEEVEEEEELDAEDGEGDEESPYGDEDGDDEGEGEEGNGSAAALNSYGRAARLQCAAENALTAVLDARPDEASAALLAQLPASACAVDEPLGAQLQRDAAYCALGLCPYQLQESLGYSAVLAAATREAEALGAAAAAGATLPLAAPLQARLCWLLPCWWAFGSGEDEENERSCAASYALLVGALRSGADMAVALQAARSLGLMLRDLGESDLQLFLPLAPAALSALAAALGACTSDEAVRWCLRLIAQLLRQTPSAWPHAPDVPAALQMLWARAEQEGRHLILRDLRRIAALQRRHGA